MSCPTWCGTFGPIPSGAAAWWSEEEPYRPKRAYNTKECRLNRRCVHVAQPETAVEGVPASVDYNKGTITPVARVRVPDRDHYETRHRNGYKVRTFRASAPHEAIDDPTFYPTYNEALAAYSSRPVFLEGELTIEITSVALVDRVEKKAP